ncbi:23S rRNA (adenine(2030)-N(6))-methyltransferase RlmJ [Taylorella equigenitalis]|uniref:Ribosomal RNA large subunit methyltransferase J n=1 Tax=Taylorella equigenitalis ATCC 35865 TaxID=743973 RepID=A0ABM5NA30_9BURK|nr:23S rRNA (adenine(2030)-N(6))-methyltransferase RlmJ [Taylorella equigenitalis]AFN35739.1 hypothetical protein KUI_0657 [Taylorella equigenitalis ATCC 35865]ASY39157.1 23S rRNA (adenine(2030)-N(6))-methyltransferase RlmJ [Taylorella equigenitalis]VEG30778.1 Protein involved in catabolism of external DNA [Taylorella equigenitalis ATCC 35865]
MFSYRHAFHAGNHADVLKHFTLIHIINYFNKKDSPYWVIDTHAGAGIYDLTSEWANTKAEYVTGIKALWNANLPYELKEYVQYIKDFNEVEPNKGPESLTAYPGSPWIALEFIRDTDKLKLFELHPTEIDILKNNLSFDELQLKRQIQINFLNGFQGLIGLLPPSTKRAIVLIDPSYEDKTDYKSVIRSIKESLKRFKTGCYLIWYPLVQRAEVHDMLRHLKNLPETKWINAQLTISKPPKDGYGLYGSGVFVINPPYTLLNSLEINLPALKQHLGIKGESSFLLEHSAQL